jgi:hypothetical protein
MSEIDQAVAARVERYRPETMPPFAALTARRRRRTAARYGAGTAVLAAAAVLGVVAAPWTPDPGGPDRLAQPTSEPPASAGAPPRPGATPIPAGKQAPTATDYAAFDRWQQKGAADYTMRLTRTCYCPRYGAVTVTVRGRKAVTPAGTPQGAEPQSVDDLFRIVFSGKADRFSVAYNGEYGYPESLDVDYITGAIDDEATYRISDYRPAHR